MPNRHHIGITKTMKKVLRGDANIVCWLRQTDKQTNTQTDRGDYNTS